MDAKGKEKGILKLEPRSRTVAESKSVLTPQVSGDRAPSSPQPSVDRLSVTWAEPGSMTSSGVNLFHLPSETPVSSEVKFSPTAGDGSEDEDYSSLSAVLRQRRASVRHSRKGRSRRPSSPFLPDESRPRRRSSVFTTSSGDTAISIEEQPVVVTQEQIFENIHLHKEVLSSVKQQPLGMRRKLKIVHQAKAYIKRHEGQLQERLAQSKNTRDIYARFNILMATKWQQLKREAANTSNLLIPWELRIKEIESHFGSVVASYFTFLRWLFWVNLVIGFILLVFVIIPEYLTANVKQAGERKIIMEEERRNATNLLTLWEFEGVLKYSPIFYGYYSNIENSEYRMPLAYFLTGLAVYIYSFVAILRKMAENSRMSKLSEKEDECIFSWKLFTGWDFMIGNAETAHNRIASVILGFKEALLEEAEKKKNLSWRIISLRALVNICVAILLVVSAFAVVTVVSRSDDNDKLRSWWRENETTIVVTVITTTFPVFFELLGLMEHYHPRKQLRLQLARIMLLNLLNLYSLIFALFSKIEGMGKDLSSLQPNLTIEAVMSLNNNTLNMSEHLSRSIPSTCFETSVPCLPCYMVTVPPLDLHTLSPTIISMPSSSFESDENINLTTKFNTKQGAKKMLNSQKYNTHTKLIAENLVEKDMSDSSNDVTSPYSILLKELERLRKISGNLNTSEINDTVNVDDDIYYDNYDIVTTEVNKNFETPLTSDKNKYTFKDLKSDTTETSEISSVDTTFHIDSEHPTYGSTTSSDDVNLNIKISKEPYSSTSSGDFFNSAEDTDMTDVTTNIFSNASESLATDSTSTNSIESNSKSTEYFLDNATNKNTILTDYEDLTTISNDIFTLTPYPTEIDSNTTYDYGWSTITLNVNKCPNVTFNCSVNCGDHNITYIFKMVNCKVFDVKCYLKKCIYDEIDLDNLTRNQTNITTVDTVYFDNHNRKMYNLSIVTKKKLLKLCWETMFGQELVKLTMMDLVFVLLGTLFMDFFRALFVRYMNRCWCWDLEKKFPEYGDFKIAENILHLINNQGMVWMGMFFSPGLVVLNVFKLIIMMYLRSWAVMTCNVPHEVVFRVSKSNNFYLALLLTMLFLCVLPVGYSIVWVKPSWHCGPFSEYDKIYNILTTNIHKILPESLHFALEYTASPAIVIPLLVLLILIIYYLTSLTNSLREANNDLKIQLRRERTEERRKMFQLADTRRRVGSSAMDNTPFARWKKALPSLPISKSIDSDDRKSAAVEDPKDSSKPVKKRGGIFEKIVGLAIDRKIQSQTSTDPSQTPNPVDEETDTDFHETLPKEILRIKDIAISKKLNTIKKSSPETKITEDLVNKHEDPKCKLDTIEASPDSKSILHKSRVIKKNEIPAIKQKHADKDSFEENEKIAKKMSKKQASETSNQSKQSDSIASVIPVITISTTESDDETLQPHLTGDKSVSISQKQTGESSKKESIITKKPSRSSSDIKSLQRQNSVDSINENKYKEKKTNEGHKYQYSL